MSAHEQSYHHSSLTEVCTLLLLLLLLLFILPLFKTSSSKAIDQRWRWKQLTWPIVWSSKIYSLDICFAAVWSDKLLIPGSTRSIYSQYAHSSSCISEVHGLLCAFPPSFRIWTLNGHRYILLICMHFVLWLLCNLFFFFRQRVVNCQA